MGKKNELSLSLIPAIAVGRNLFAQDEVSECHTCMTFCVITLSPALYVYNSGQDKVKTPPFYTGDLDLFKAPSTGEVVFIKPLHIGTKRVLKVRYYRAFGSTYANIWCLCVALYLIYKQGWISLKAI